MINSRDKIIIKIICITAAAATWLYVMTTINPETIRNIDNIALNIENEEVLIEEGYYLYENKNDRISVQIKGRRNEILELERKDITAKIDVADYTEGSVKIPVEIFLPQNVEIINYEPKQISCTIEKFIGKSVDVEVVKEGKPSDGFYLTEPELSLSAVIVSGPETLVESVKKAVVILDVTDAEKNISKNLPVNLYNDKNILVELQTKPSYIRVNTDVYPLKKVDVKVPVKGTIEQGYMIDSIVINPAEMQIAGNQEDIEQISSVETEPMDITGQTGVFTQKLKLIDNNFFSDTSEVQVTVILEKIVEKKFMYDITDIKFINIAEGYIVDKENENRQIIVRIEGPESRLSGTKKEDIILEIDLQNISENNIIGKVSYKTEIEYKNIELNMNEFPVRLLENR